MKKIHCAPQVFVINHLREVLESHGIECTIQSQSLGTTAGELMPSGCWAELWVLDDSKYQAATEILTRTLAEEKGRDKGRWRCHRCGEELEEQFTECWRCGATRAR